MPPHSIDEVLARLDRIVAAARRAEDPLGYFAALYRDVTARVAATIEDGGFDDGARMEWLDVVFANRYFDALDARGTEAGPPRAWRRTFAAADRWRPDGDRRPLTDEPHRLMPFLTPTGVPPTEAELLRTVVSTLLTPR
ncbi:MAG: DUF5995 family protein [Salinibacter sp.]